MAEPTTTESIVADTEKFVKKLLLSDLTEHHRYHNLSHTLTVRENCLEIGRRLDLSEEELEILELACLLHDTGFSEVYAGHEAVSHRIAREYLLDKGYPEGKLRRVLQCIDITFPPNQPTDLLEKVIRDADMANLGSPNYPETLAALRHEWEIFLGQSFKDRDWFRLNRDFLRQHSFYTEVAEEMYGATKAINEKYLQRMAKQLKEKKKKDKDKDPGTIQGSRSAQMMFKTSLRNHIDLSNLADSKANIMLSVNSGILTVGAPLAFTFVQNYPLLWIPLIVLVLTCLVSLIFATLATRPLKMTGYTTREQIESGKSNLFFFGNFYDMSYQEYSEGIQLVVADENKLEDSIQRDLYFLGKSLGRKYSQLRACYTIFMYGMILTIIALIVTYSYTLVTTN